jgi:hypothetical protein
MSLLTGKELVGQIVFPDCFQVEEQNTRIDVIASHCKSDTIQVVFFLIVGIGVVNTGSIVSVEVFRPEFLQTSANDEVAIKVQNLVQFREKPSKNVPVIGLNRNVTDGQIQSLKLGIIHDLKIENEVVIPFFKRFQRGFLFVRLPVRQNMCVKAHVVIVFENRNQRYAQVLVITGIRRKNDVKGGSVCHDVILSLLY